MTLFGIDMAGEIAAGFDGLLNPGTLRKTPVSSISNVGDGVPGVPVNYAVQGIQQSYSIITRMAAGIPEGDVELLLIADLCGAVPAIGDKVQMLGDWFTIKNVSRDPAQATYSCQSTKVLS